MPSETSNAPAQIWARDHHDPVLRAHGVVIGTSRGDLVTSDEWDEYVRRDLVAYTVDEIASVISRAQRYRQGQVLPAAEAVGSLLLSRIEGDQPTGDCETDCVEHCRGECGDLSASGGESA